MSKIHPFKGIRPKNGLASEVASYPYDVINSIEAREIASGNQNSFLHIVKSEIDLPEDVDSHSDAVYQKAADNFNDFISRSVLVEDDKQSLYLYTLEEGDHSQVGVFAGFSLVEYQEGKIRKHEFTRPVKENDRISHIKALNAQTGPGILTYEADPEIDKFVKILAEAKPEVDFLDPDGVRHIIHKIDDANNVEKLQKLFANISLLYIADGHHRSAAASRMYDEKKKNNANHTGNEEYCFYLAVAFPHNQLKIIAYNRVALLPNGLSEDGFLEKLKNEFIVENTSEKEPLTPAVFSIYVDKKWYKATPKNIPTDALDRLDVAILQNKVLSDILGIHDPKNDDNVDFIGGSRGTVGIEKVVDNGNFDIGFSLFPTSIEELMTVAGENKIMPPKSTWFSPKLRSGLLSHKLD